MAENREEKVGEESEKEEDIIEDEFKMNKSAMKGENFVKSFSNRRVSFRLIQINIFVYRDKFVHYYPKVLKKSEGGGVLEICTLLLHPFQL